VASNRAGQYSRTILNAQCSLRQWVSGFLLWMTLYNNLSYPEETLPTKLDSGERYSVTAKLLPKNIYEDIYIYIYIYMVCKSSNEADSI
jgi:hypothetical protein